MKKKGPHQHHMQLKPHVKTLGHRHVRKGGKRK